MSLILLLARIIRASTLLLACLIFIGSAIAEPTSVSLAWDPSPEPDVTSYRVYFGTESQVYSGHLDVDGATQTSLTNLSSGTTYFAVVTAFNSAGLESPPSGEITFITDTDTQTQAESGHLILIEAETGAAVAPMAAEIDSEASVGQFVEANGSAGEGTLSLALDAPSAQPYYAWCRVLAPSDSSDSFFVSIDGQDEFVYHIHGSAAPILQPWSDNWLWTRIVNEDGSPKLLSLAGGMQDLVFRTREPTTGLDRVILSSDPDFVPNDNTPTSGDFIAITSQPAVRPNGDELELHFATTATGATTYQWYKDGIAIPGATDPAYSIGISGEVAAGEYHVVATTGGFSITSELTPIFPMVDLRLTPFPGTPTSSSRIEIEVTGPLNQAVVVEQSVDLIEWQFLGSFVITSGNNTIWDFDSIGSTPRKFYRVVPITP